MSLTSPNCSELKKPQGAVKTGTSVSFGAFCPGAAEGRLHLMPADEKSETFPMALQQDGWFTATHLFLSEGLFFYAYELVGIGFIGPDGMQREPYWYQQTVYRSDYVAPEEFAGGIMYQIFPDRFYASPEPNPDDFPGRIIHSNKKDTPKFRTDPDGVYRNNDFFGGTLNGIREKLDYIGSFGTTCIYLNPIFKSVSNHRYDTADYMRIDPMLGTEEDFVLLCKEAAVKGIRIIIDGVFSHTGDESIYFDINDVYGKGAYNHEDSPYRSWYKFREDGTYTSWWGFLTLPEVNEEDPGYREFITGKGGVVDYWLGKGASGFRLDVADELPDSFIKGLRAAVKAHGDDKLLLGEVWEDASNKISYGQRRRYFLGEELDSVMNYPAKEAILDFVRYGDGRRFVSRISTLCNNYPPEMLDLCMNLISTHDTARAINALTVDDPGDREQQAKRRLSEDEYLRGAEMLRLATAIQFAIPGIPSIYYGDEAGMTGFKDPFNRGYYNWEDPDKHLIGEFRKIAALRTANKDVFAHGEFRPIEAGERFLSFARVAPAGTVVFAVNMTDAEKTFAYEGAEISVKPWDYIFKRI